MNMHYLLLFKNQRKVGKFRPLNLVAPDFLHIVSR